jgi:hypothetical protein
MSAAAGRTCARRRSGRSSCIAAAAVTALVAAAGCGGNPPPHGELAASEHLAEADRHERVAAEHERRAQLTEQNPSQLPVTCIDQPLAGVPYSGTEPIQVMKPCWRTDDSEAHRQVARRNLSEAAEHRATAAGLLAAERRACAGLGADEVAHGLFFHTDDMVRIEPYRVDGALRGVRVVFARVSGLDVDWAWRAAACEQARAAVMGHRPTFLAYSPLGLPDVRVRVGDVADGIEVVVYSDRAGIAATAWNRAQELAPGAVAGGSQPR